MCLQNISMYINMECNKALHNMKSALRQKRVLLRTLWHMFRVLFVCWSRVASGGTAGLFSYSLAGQSKIIDLVVARFDEREQKLAEPPDAQAQNWPIISTSFTCQGDISEPPQVQKMGNRLLVIKQASESYCKEARCREQVQNYSHFAIILLQPSNYVWLCFS